MQRTDMRSRKNRLNRLEVERRIRCDPDDPGLIIRYRDGEPVPPIPSDAVPCLGCGEVHVLYIRERIVASREEAEALRANARN
jgi:hypothetical protein